MDKGKQFELGQSDPSLRKVEEMSPGGQKLLAASNMFNILYDVARRISQNEIVTEPVRLRALGWADMASVAAFALRTDATGRSPRISIAQADGKEDTALTAAMILVAESVQRMMSGVSPELEQMFKEVTNESTGE